MSGTGVLGESFAPVVLSTAASGPAGHHNGWRGRVLTEPAARIEAVDLTSGDVTYTAPPQRHQDSGAL